VLAQYPQSRSQPKRGFRAAEWHVFWADPTVEAGPVDDVEHEPIVDLAGPRMMPSGAVSDLEVLDPAEVCQNRFGKVPSRPLQVTDVAEDLSAGPPASATHELIEFWWRISERPLH